MTGEGERDGLARRLDETLGVVGEKNVTQLVPFARDEFHFFTALGKPLGPVDAADAKGTTSRGLDRDRFVEKDRDPSFTCDTNHLVGFIR